MQHIHILPVHKGRREVGRGEERRAHKISFSLPAPVALAQETVGVGAASLKGSEFILVTD